MRRRINLKKSSRFSRDEINKFNELKFKIYNSLDEYFESTRCNTATGILFCTEFLQNNVKTVTQWSMTSEQLKVFAYLCASYQTRDIRKVSEKSAEEFKKMLINTPRNVFYSHDNEIARIRFYCLKRNATVTAEKKVMVEVPKPEKKKIVIQVQKSEEEEEEEVVGGRWYQMSCDMSPVSDEWVNEIINSPKSADTIHNCVGYLSHHFDEKAIKKVKQHEKTQKNNAGNFCKVYH